MLSLPRPTPIVNVMIRGMYTAVSGMRAQQWRLDAVANNLANVNTDGFKREQAAFRTSSSLLLRRMNDDGRHNIPFGSADASPIIGRLGTGVELNELFTCFTQGALRETNSQFDVALDGEGFFVVSTPWGDRYTRNGSFILGREGLLLSKEGYPVMGENGPIAVNANNFQIDPEGRIWINAEFGSGDPFNFVSMENNEWNEPELLDTLRVVSFDSTRYLRKQGSSLFSSNEFSGPAFDMENPERAVVVQGFIEAANVDPVREMVQMIEVNRAYEANQRIIQSHDTMLGILINQTARIN